MNKHRRRNLIIVSLFLLSVFACSLPFLFNEARLLVFALPLYTYPLPPQTTVVSLESEVAVLGGAGNHCDFSAAIHLRSALSEQELRDYYAGVTFPTVEENSGSAAIAGLKGAVPVDVSFDPSDPQLVRLSIVDVGLYMGGLQMLDPRCH